MPLGSGTNVAVIYAQGGEDRLLPLPQGQALDWSRVRNGVSEANLTVLADDDLTWAGLKRVHVWAHELVIFRDGQRVWEGPIRRIERGRSSVVIKASDVLGWTQRRPVHTDRTTVTAGSVVTEADLDLDRAFAAHDPNVLSHVTARVHASVAQITRDLKKNQGYYYDDLTSLTEQGLQFTTLGRGIILAAVEDPLGVTQTVILERDTSVVPTIIEDGESLNTFATATGDEDTAATYTGTTSYYGHLGTLVQAQGITDTTALTGVATRAVKGAYPAPTIIDIGGDAALDPGCPLALSDLVPGVHIPVTSLDQGVTTTMLLESVKVTEGSAGEAVTITLSQIGNYA